MDATEGKTTDTTEARIVQLLESTGRENIQHMIAWLYAEKFFDAPASTKYHGCYKGGLANHSLRVWELVSSRAAGLKLDTVMGPGQKPLPLKDENVIVACLLHDICKVGAYIGDVKPYRWNKAQPAGHALLSIKRAREHIELELIEIMMIRFHMGVYAMHEFYGAEDWGKKNAEYSLRGDKAACAGMSKEESKAKRYGNSLANAWYHNPVTKLVYFCDEIASMEERAKGTGV